MKILENIVNLCDMCTKAKTRKKKCPKQRVINRAMKFLSKGGIPSGFLIIVECNGFDLYVEGS